MNAQTQLLAKELPKEQSLSKLEIVPRQVKIDFSDLDSFGYFAENSVLSAFYAALSAIFPPGEGEFIKSVKWFEKYIEDDKLKEEIKLFTAQEAHHSLQHKLLNKQLQKQGFRIDDIERMIAEELRLREMKWSPFKRLRRTVCAEHFTAVMAYQALSMPDSLDKAPESLRNLLLWHAIEEIEHKSVAFDVYQQMANESIRLRLHYLYFALFEFPMNLWGMTRHLLKRAGVKVNWAQRKFFLQHLFGKRGVYSSTLSLYVGFLWGRFHPWQHDDTDLVDHWKQKLAHNFVNTDA